MCQSIQNIPTNIPSYIHVLFDLTPLKILTNLGMNKCCQAAQGRHGNCEIVACSFEVYKSNFFNKTPVLQDIVAKLYSD